MKKLVIAILVVLFLASGFWYWQSRTDEVIVLDLPPAVSYQEPDLSAENIAEQVTEEVIKTTSTSTSSQNSDLVVAKKQINLAVPFTAQAPLGDWSQPWQDACEEASFLMLDYYYQNKKMPTSAEVASKLEAMVNWQIAHWGDHHNLTIAELKNYIEANSTYRVEIIEDLDLAKIKNLLDKQQPVIIPADGHLLANPYFTDDGPDYHMLVIKGYQDDYLITNDPGTRRGADFIYQADHLLASIFDWNQNELRASGKKRGLVISPR